jgi:hypothetical protein
VKVPLVQLDGQVLLEAVDLLELMEEPVQQEEREQLALLVAQGQLVGSNYFYKRYIHRKCWQDHLEELEQQDSLELRVDLVELVPQEELEQLE